MARKKNHSLSTLIYFICESTGTMKWFIPSSTLNMCRSKITAWRCLVLCTRDVYISIRWEEKNKLWKDPFMKLNYLCCIALKPCMRLLIQRDFNCCR